MYFPTGQIMALVRTPGIFKFTVFIITLILFYWSKYAHLVPSDIPKVLEKNSSRRKYDVLLLTYMRSGSTFTADLLQQAPDVIYAYEPLKAFSIKGRFEPKFVCDITNGFCRPPLLTVEDPDFISKAVSDFYQCKFNLLPKPFIHDHGKSIAFTKYKLCLEQTRNKTKCEDDVIKTCKKSTKMIKTVRMSMSLTFELMKNNPDLKVVYLVRDPRAMFSSQIMALLLDVRNPNSIQQIDTQCQIIREDLELIKSTQNIFPDRIKMYRYEALMDDVTESFKDLYNYLGLEMTDNVYQWIADHTSGVLQRDGIFGTVRNSSITASAWRRNCNPLFIRTIDQFCQDVYDIAGYNILQNISQIRDLRVLSWKKII